MPFEEIKHPRKRAFLAAYAITGSVKFAAQEAEIKRGLHYDWKAQDEAYAAAFELAEAMAADVLTDEAKRRAHKGTKEYILYRGEIVTDAQGEPLMKTRYSDALLQFLIENLNRKFVPKREIAHSTPEPLKVEVKKRFDLSGLSEEELQTLERIADRLGVSGEGRTPAPAGTED